MQNSFEVKTEIYSGPLHKLLELIREKKIDINQLGLASVTADFMGYVQSLEEINPSILADFVSTAATLLLIKSKTLLPSLELSEEEEADIAGLEQRLVIYRNFAAKVRGEENNASSQLHSLWSSKKQSFSRSMLQAIAHQPLFYPPEKLGLSDLRKSMSDLLLGLKELLPSEGRVKIKTVTLQEKMDELKNKIELAASQTFNSLKQKQSKQEIIVLFLALLHLFADKVLDLEQSDRFDDIKISKKQANV